MSTILVCDDEEGILDVTKIVLEEEGYTVKTLIRCDSIEQIREAKPDLLLLDLWIPELGGEEIARQLKQDKELKSLPVVIVSANKDAEHISKQVKAEGFLGKPFDIQDLINIVKKNLLQ